MPPIEVCDLHQTALLWGATTTNDYGETVIGTPTEIPCRWEYVKEESLGPNGNPIALDARVVTDREVPMDSLLWLGSASEWYGTGSAGSDSEVMQAVTYNFTPDLKNRSTRRVYGLMKYKDAPPAS